MISSKITTFTITDRNNSLSHNMRTICPLLFLNTSRLARSSFRSGHIYSWRASYVYAHVVVVLESSKRKTKGVIFSNHSICFIRELYLLELYCQDKRNHANIKVIEVNHIRLWARQPLCTVMIRRCNTSSISGKPITLFYM
ncbi:uncharacterized protein LOC109839964 isoform X2 [Asparagus officinalis]|uniref:uncharacterized protein LOC109839964 isoform X2 n=1 Tax=Asparagus officinalis TaxID=4686 RepID=UPI00098E29AE|nr:uncharacterized protein LOC109839964 isoform X2 [Asparagus officinalis]